MKRLKYVFAMLAVILSDIMCFVVGFQYRDMICGIEHAGYSAPAHLAFFSSVPFLIGIIVCIALSIKFNKK